MEEAKINDLVGDNFPVLEKKSEHINQKDSTVLRKVMKRDKVCIF